MEKMRVHLFVYGRVQGVFFRAGAQKRARKLGLTGWAHNLIDGRVELVVEGEKKAVEQFTQWCRKGTLLAKVERVDVREEHHAGEFEDFSIHEFGF